jgi:hypothetical protein
MLKFRKKNEWDFETNLEENQLARKRLEEYFNSVKPPLWRRIVVKILPDSIKETLKAWVRR